MLKRRVRLHLRHLLLLQNTVLRLMGVRSRLLHRHLAQWRRAVDGWWRLTLRRGLLLLLYRELTFLHRLHLLQLHLVRRHTHPRTSASHTHSRHSRHPHSHISHTHRCGVRASRARLSE